MDASTTKTQNDAGSRPGRQRRKTPLDELRDHYGRGAFNVFQTAFLLYLLVDEARNGRSPWLLWLSSLACALMIYATVLHWKVARAEWNLAKSLYESADELRGENSAP
jgi:hypothetical protein